MMNQLKVAFTKAIDRNRQIGDISNYLDKVQKNSIDNLLWQTDNYKPKVEFSIAHGNDCLFLKYFVTEDSIRAVYCNVDDPVYKDSCVEFFIAFNNQENYYNLEFNCIGTCHAGYGADRHDRELLPKENLSKIKSMTVIKPANQNISWELTLMIPVEVFSNHQLTQLNGLKSTGNFFKCGDDLPVPHYLAWNNVMAEKPNFHLPEYFGKVEFV
jgi:hypothetical protein